MNCINVNLLGLLFAKAKYLQSSICRSEWQDAFYIEDNRFFFSEGGYAGLAKGDKLTISRGQTCFKLQMNAQ
jgi:hypothetical protein